MKTNDIAIENFKKGDIFYVEVNKKYFFMQIIHIVEKNEMTKYQYGVFFVVFEKTFHQLPASITELDTSKIYLPKYFCKNSTLFFGNWSDDLSIKFRQDLMGYELKDKYEFVYFGNTQISQDFTPKIKLNFSISVLGDSDENGIPITYDYLSGAQWILRVFEEEEKGALKKRRSIQPKYFHSWLEYVEPEHIVKTEKIIAKLEGIDNSNFNLNELKKCVKSINKLEDKQPFIGTTEAEDIFETLVKIATKNGLNPDVAIKQIDDIREW